MSKPEGVECRLTLLTGWEGIGLYALTFKTMTQNNFCSVISPLELNTRSIPFPTVMLVLRVRYLWFRFNTCAAVIFATIRCLRYFESDFKSLKITSPLHGYCTQPPFFALLRNYYKRHGRNRSEFDWCAANEQLWLICGIKNEYYATLFFQIIHSFFCS